MPAIVEKVMRKNNKSAAFRSKHSPIGLDLGSAMIKMIQFHNQRGKLSVTRGFISRTPEGAFTGGELTNPDLLARKIEAVINKKGWHGRSFNISLNSQAFYYRTVRLPVMDRTSLSNAMYWEALQNIPLDEEEVIFDYCPLNNWPGDESNTREYILAVTSKKTAENYTGILDQAGLKCTALEIEPLSLFRSFTARQPGQAEYDKYEHENNMPGNIIDVLIHIGYSNTTVIISKKSELLFYRSIKTGASNYIHTLQDSQKCSVSNAEKLLFSSQKEIVNLVLPGCEQLALKIEQTINSWLDQFNRFDPVLQQIHFCGGGAFIPGLTSLIGRHLQVKHLLYNPLAGISIDSTESNLKKHQKRKNIFFPVAHGLALRGWK